ncbi:MAG: GNAT family N-acetyltransferase [Candidatus Hodarchaeota archaeon]
MDLSTKIKTNRLILRLCNPEDFSFFLEIIGDDLVSNNINYIINQKDFKNPEFIFHSIIDSFKTPYPIYLFIIIKKDINDSIGVCGLKILTEYNEAICFYSLHSKYRGYGFAIEAMKKVIEYGFLELKLSKLFTYINPKSSATWKVAERVGMKYLGQIQISEPLSEVMYFSIDKNEFDVQNFI